MGFSSPKTPSYTSQPLPAPAATFRAPTIDGPASNPGAGLALRIAQSEALNGRNKLVIPLNPVFSGGAGISIPQGRS